MLSFREAGTLNIEPYYKEVEPNVAVATLLDSKVAVPCVMVATTTVAHKLITALCCTATGPLSTVVTILFRALHGLSGMPQHTGGAQASPPGVTYRSLPYSTSPPRYAEHMQGLLASRNKANLTHIGRMQTIDTPAKGRSPATVFSLGGTFAPSLLLTNMTACCL